MEIESNLGKPDEQRRPRAVLGDPAGLRLEEAVQKVLVAVEVSAKGVKLGTVHPCKHRKELRRVEERLVRHRHAALHARLLGAHFSILLAVLVVDRVVCIMERLGSTESLNLVSSTSKFQTCISELTLQVKYLAQGTCARFSGLQLRVRVPCKDYSLPSNLVLLPVHFIGPIRAARRRGDIGRVRAAARVSLQRAEERRHRPLASAVTCSTWRRRQVRRRKMANANPHILELAVDTLHRRLEEVGRLIVPKLHKDGLSFHPVCLILWKANSSEPSLATSCTTPRHTLQRAAGKCSSRGQIRREIPCLLFSPLRAVHSSPKPNPVRQRHFFHKVYVSDDDVTSSSSSDDDDEASSSRGAQPLDRSERSSSSSRGNAAALASSSARTTLSA